MKIKNKFIAGFTALLVLAFGLAGAQVGYKQMLDNLWMQGDKKVLFGATPNANISYTGGNLVLDVTSGGGKVSIPDGILSPTATFSGAISTTGNITTTGIISTSNNLSAANLSATGNISGAGTILSSGTGSLGWSLATGANTACNTTCTNACVLGWDTASGEVAVACDSASADKCLCAGAN